MNITRRKLLELMGGTALAALLPVGMANIETPVWRFVYKVNLKAYPTKIKWVPIDYMDEQSIDEIEYSEARFAA